MAKEPDPGKLAGLRERIDQLDAQLIDLLNERAKVVVEIGALKRSSGGAIYAPHRESEVLARVLGKNQGPLPDRCIDRIYRELMSGSFALERPLRIGYLGPEGSAGHVAARLQFGASVDYENLRSVAGIFTEVQRGHVDYGLVPIANPLGGSVRESIAGFLRAQDSVSAYAEVRIAQRFHLFAPGSPKEVQAIFAKPEDLDQCRAWVATQYPAAQIHPTASASQALGLAQAQMEAGNSGVAAIGSKLAAEAYGLPLLFESIEDEPNQCLRYLVVSQQGAEPSGQDKTALIARVPSHAGSLATLLSLLSQYEVELSHIESCTGLGGTFFVELLGHRHSEPMDRLLVQMAPLCEELRVLGSYPRSQRVL